MISEANYERRAENVTDAVAQLEVEGGTKFRAAVSRPTFDGSDATATRTAINANGENSND